eukprot:5391423-Pyramimonas_sp.AAC.1
MGGEFQFNFNIDDGNGGPFGFGSDGAGAQPPVAGGGGVPPPPPPHDARGAADGQEQVHCVRRPTQKRQGPILSEARHG